LFPGASDHQITSQLVHPHLLEQKLDRFIHVSLLLFSTSHAQLPRKIVAQASHNHDNVDIHHNVSSIGHKSFNVAPITMSSPHSQMVNDTNGDQESYITNSSSNMIPLDLPTSATRSLLSNSFTCPQAFFIFGDSLTDTGNIQLLGAGIPGTILNYPYGESYTFTNELGHNRYSDGRLIVDFIAQAFGFPFFEPILLELDKGFQTDYTHGVNFAYSGATVIPNNTKNPIYLQLELDQFFDYKKALLSSPRK